MSRYNDDEKFNNFLCFAVTVLGVTMAVLFAVLGVERAEKVIGYAALAVLAVVAVSICGCVLGGAVRFVRGLFK